VIAALPAAVVRPVSPDDRGCALAETALSFTFVQKVKNRRKGTSRVSSKHQVTIPTDALRAAGLEVGERLIARADGPGRVVFEREVDVLAEFSGALTGVYLLDELAGLREEWD
jgi:bifunctional DNA-binding transcriptional regulator/antitoxin component of YhaV-PrlF toxin-antitoxin module